MPVRPFLISVLASLAAMAVAPPAAAVGRSGGTAPQCRLAAYGSRAIAVCSNPGPAPVGIELHVKCRRWWDPAIDSRPIEVGPRRSAVLADHCWKEVQAVWVTRR